MNYNEFDEFRSRKLYFSKNKFLKELFKYTKKEYCRLDPNPIN